MELWLRIVIEVKANVIDPSYRTNDSLTVLNSLHKTEVPTNAFVRSGTFPELQIIYVLLHFTIFNYIYNCIAYI